MPSDTKRTDLVALLSPAAQPFVTAVADVAAAARAHLEEAGVVRAPAAAAAAVLGPFGEAHLDLDQFGTVFEGGTPLSGSGAESVQRALKVLDALRESGSALWQCRVPRGAELSDVVHRCLAEAGRAFGAARVVQAARRGDDVVAASGMLVTHRFGRWNRAERDLAPPLLLRVAGEDLRPAALADVLDGRVKILLVVEGPCSVAPLARLITPATWVQQATDPAALADFVAWGGPAIAALVPEGAAVFTHDPRVGLTVVTAPAPRASVGGVSVAQQRDELALLERLARPAGSPEVVTPARAEPEAPADSAGQLAAWLIARAGIEDG